MATVMALKSDTKSNVTHTFRQYFTVSQLEKHRRQDDIKRKGFTT